MREKRRWERQKKQKKHTAKLGSARHPDNPERVTRFVHSKVNRYNTPKGDPRVHDHGQPTIRATHWSKNPAFSYGRSQSRNSIRPLSLHGPQPKEEEGM